MPVPYSGDIEILSDRHEEWLELMAELAEEQEDEEEEVAA